MDRAISEDLDGQIAMTHERLVHAVTARLPTMPLQTKEHSIRWRSCYVVASPTRLIAISRLSEKPTK